jgi:hypothetical protein
MPVRPAPRFCGGLIYSKAQENPRAQPPRGGGGGGSNRINPNRLGPKSRRSRRSRPRNLGRTGRRGRGAQEDAVW